MKRALQTNYPLTYRVIKSFILYFQTGFFFFLLTLQRLSSISNQMNLFLLPFVFAFKTTGGLLLLYIFITFLEYSENEIRTNYLQSHDKFNAIIEEINADTQYPNCTCSYGSWILDWIYGNTGKCSYLNRKCVNCNLNSDGDLKRCFNCDLILCSGCDEEIHKFNVFIDHKRKEYEVKVGKKRDDKKNLRGDDEEDDNNNIQLNNEEIIKNSPKKIVPYNQFDFILIRFILLILNIVQLFLILAINPFDDFSTIVKYWLFTETSVTILVHFLLIIMNFIAILTFKLYRQYLLINLYLIRRGTRHLWIQKKGKFSISITEVHAVNVSKIKYYHYATLFFYCSMIMMIVGIGLYLIPLCIDVGSPCLNFNAVFNFY